MQVAQFQVVACVQHSAVSVSTSAYQVVAGFLSGSYDHARSVEVFYQQSFCGLRSEVSKVNNQSVASCFVYFSQSFHHIFFALYYGRTFVDFSVVCSYDSFSSVLGQSHRKAVTAYCNDSQFDFRHVDHDFIPPLLCIFDCIGFLFGCSPLVPVSVRSGSLPGFLQRFLQCSPPDG